MKILSDSSTSLTIILPCKSSRYTPLRQYVALNIYCFIHRVLALEKCLASLDAYCRQPLLYQDTIPKLEKDRVLSEMIDGLDYIHSQKLIYRDIKPENVLIYLYGCSSVIKWADFGISRAVERGKEYFTRKRQGTERWLAPELIEAMENREKETVKSITNNDFTLCCQGSVECDIFALGCVYFFFLVPGVHPFGEKDCHIRENIKIGAPVNINCNNLTIFCFRISLKKSPTFKNRLIKRIFLSQGR